MFDILDKRLRVQLTQFENCKDENLEKVISESNIGFLLNKMKEVNEPMHEDFLERYKNIRKRLR